MLRITIELLPGGTEAGKKTIAVGEIWNDGTGTPFSGNYEARFRNENDEVVRSGRAIAYPRHLLGPWFLLYEALKATR